MLGKPIAASTDLGFFSQSRSKSAPSLSSSTVTTTTRLIRKPQPHTSPPSIPSRSSSLSSSPLSSPPSSPPHSSPNKKRKSPPQPPRPAKKARAEKREPRKRVSPRSSRFNAAVPSPEPIYRSSRSRSTSLFPAGSASPVPARHWATDDDGDPGGDHSSSAKVVQDLMKNYKACMS